MKTVAHLWRGYGRSLPATGGAPSWLSGAVANEFKLISGTSGAGGALANAYSGWAITSAGVIVIGAAGGHGTGSYDNRVVSLNLMDNSPTWTQRIASSSAHTTSVVAYEADGKPKGRHTYHSTFYSPSLDRVLLTGVRYDLEQNTFDAVDAINPSAWTWSTAGGYASVTPPGYYPSVQDGSGDLWRIGSSTTVKYTVGTNTWSAPSITGAVSPGVRYPWCWDSSRSQFFGLCWADGEGFGTGVNAVRMSGTTQSAITLNSIGGALAQFNTDAPTYAGMCYDSANDRFLFFSNDHETHVYIITPNGTTTWDISLMTLGGGSATLPTTHTPIVSKWSYRADLGGVVCMPDSAAGIYFLRTT